MNAQQATPAVRRPAQAQARPLAPGVTVWELLGDRDGCHGLHQGLLRFTGGAVITGAAGGQGEAWYVTGGSGVLEAAEAVALRPGTAVWLGKAARYRCRARPGLQILVSTVRAGPPAGPPLLVSAIDDCEPERTGDREFRVLLSAGLAVTQFAGLIPPGRAPEHHHAYDEVVHVLAGHGMVHLPGGQAQIVPGTSVYLPPGVAHCLENSGQDQLQVLGVFYPAGSPAAKQTS